MTASEPINEIAAAVPTSGAISDAPSPPKSLVTKLAEVMGEVERVAKRGRNDFHKYDYATEADITSAVRQHMAVRHLMLVPSVESVEWRGEGGIAMIHVRFTVHDGDNGEMLTFHIFAEGQDKGDKALYKAMTGATKYALLKLFLIPTGDDPERESGPPLTRGQQRELQQAEQRRASVENAPYADRERPPQINDAGVMDEPPKDSFSILMARRAKLPAEVQGLIPTDEEMHAIPPKELTDYIPAYIDAITAAVKRRKLSLQEQQELKAMFLGDPRAQLRGQKHNPHFVYALFKFLRTDEL